MMRFLFNPALLFKQLSFFMCILMVALIIMVPPADRMVYAATGDVEITSFTIAGSAAGTGSTDNATYNTYATNTDQVTVRGTYQLARNVDEESPATVSITLTCKDIETYFDESHKYFTTDYSNITWPVDSKDQTVTQTDDGVVVSFTVCGTQWSVATFIIGYTFNVSEFAGWIPDDKLLAEVTTGGDVVAANKRTVTASVVEQTNRLRFFSNSSTNIGLDQYAMLDLHMAHNINNATRWLLEPGTALKMELNYPAAAKVTIPSPPRSGYAMPIDTSTPGTVVWDFGLAGPNGIPADMSRFGMTANSYSYTYTIDKQIPVLFPSGDFSIGDEVTLTAKLTYTLAGDASPTVRTLSITFNIIDSFIHARPLNLEFGNSYVGKPVTVNIGASGNSPSAQYAAINAIYNDGTGPIPEVCLTVYNGTNTTDSELRKNNITIVRIYNVGATYQTRLVYTIEGGGESREVEYITGKAGSVGGNVGVTNATAGLNLLPGEYIDKIEAYPLDDSSGILVNALPVSAAFRMSLVFASWPGGVFPDGTPIKQDDYVTNTSELSWKGESKPELHTSGTIISKTLDNGMGPGTTVLMRSLPGDQQRSVFYGFNPIYPEVSLVYQAGENGSKAPTQTLGVNLRLSQNYDVTGTWKDPIVYYVPPAQIEVDTGQPLQVFLTSNNSIVPGVAATMTQVTLDGRAAYKIAVTGGLTVPNNTQGYYIPLKLTVKNGSMPGNYFMHQRNDITRGLLFGTMDAPYSIVYGDIINKSNLYSDTGDLDGNPQTGYLVTSLSSQFSVSELSKLDVKAEMFNNFAGEWQNVNDAAAEATVGTDAAGEGRFRLIVTNSGNSWVGNIRLLDILPYLGADENTVLNPTSPKKSEWTATLKYEPVVSIYNNMGEDKTADFAGAYSIQYCTNGNPSYNGGAGANTIQRSGSTTFANDGTFGTAKSFLFNWSSATIRLLPGYQLVIEGIIKAPDGVLPGDDGKVAFNAFAAQAQFFTAPSDGTGTTGSLSEPVRQKFTLRDMGDAEITKNGFVFKDLNNNGKYNAAQDVLYEDVTVELWRSDASGNPVGAGALSSVKSDANGQYEFHSLGAGDYLIKFIKPVGAPYDPYAFVARGADIDAADSHVDPATGRGSRFTVNASAEVRAPTNAGIKATGLVDLSFYTMNPGKTALSTYGMVVPVTEAIAAMTGSVTAGSGVGELHLPVNTHLAAGETNPKTYTISWDNVTDAIEFEVEYDSYSVSYSYTGSAPAGAPAVPSAQTCVCYDSVNVAADPVLTGYDFSGWTPTTTSGIVVSGTPASFTMPGNAVVFEGSWSEQDLTIHFDNNGGIGFAASFTGQIGDVVTLPNEEFTHTEYDFVGFDHVLTAVVPTFASADLMLDEAVIDMLFTDDTNEAVLYAVYSGNGDYNGTLTPTPSQIVTPAPAYLVSTYPIQTSITGNTGDTTDILGWMLALCLSLLGILCILLWRIRRAT